MILYHGSNVDIGTIDLSRSSAAEYLSYVASVGEQSFIWNCDMKRRKYG